MKSNRILIFFCAFIMLLSLPAACVNDAAPAQPQKTDIVNTAGITAQPEVTEPDAANSVTVGGRVFTIEEINAGIKDTLNNLWYLYGDYSTSEHISSNKDLLLGKDIEYNLYLHLGPGYASSSGIYDEVSPKMLYVVITNIKPPSSTEEKPLLYTFALCITEGGVESDFYTEDSATQESANDAFHDEMIYLGHYMIRIDEVTKPQYEEMDSEWVESTKRSIRLYMDANFTKILEPGNYHVYVKKFFKGDTDSLIFLEHENGNIYWAFYYFVHDIGDYEADINGLELYEDFNSSEPYKKYYERIKSDPAVSLEYSVSEPAPSPPKWPESYSAALAEYKIIADYNFHDIFYLWNIMNDPDYEEWLNENIPVLNEAGISWDTMLACDDDFWKAKDVFGYALKDLNGDGSDELILLLKGYTVLAIYSIADGKLKLVDNYWSRYHCCAIDKSGLFYIFNLDSAGDWWYAIERLSDDGSELFLVEQYGMESWDYDTDERFPESRYYKVIDGKSYSEREIITEAEFDEFYEKYPVFDWEKGAEITESALVFIPILD